MPNKGDEVIKILLELLADQTNEEYEFHEIEPSEETA